jgi:hypothetical protein
MCTETSIPRKSPFLFSIYFLSITFILHLCVQASGIREQPKREADPGDAHPLWRNKPRVGR